MVCPSPGCGLSRPAAEAGLRMAGGARILLFAGEQVGVMQAATATTVPGGLTVTLTYNGSATAPTAA